MVHIQVCVCVYAPMQHVYHIPWGALGTHPAKHSKFSLVTYVVLVWFRVCFQSVIPTSYVW